MKLEALERQTGSYGTVDKGGTVEVHDSLGKELLEVGTFKVYEPAVEPEQGEPAEEPAVETESQPEADVKETETAKEVKADKPATDRTTKEDKAATTRKTKAH